MNQEHKLYESIPDILTVAQLQEVLCIGKKAAYDLIREKKIESIKIGRSIRIPKHCLLDFIENTCYNKSEHGIGLPVEMEV